MDEVSGDIEEVEEIEEIGEIGEIGKPATEFDVPLSVTSVPLCETFFTVPLSVTSVPLCETFFTVPLSVISVPLCETFFTVPLSVKQLRVTSFVKYLLRDLCATVRDLLHCASVRKTVKSYEFREISSP